MALVTDNEIKTVTKNTVFTGTGNEWIVDTGFDSDNDSMESNPTLEVHRMEADGGGGFIYHDLGSDPTEDISITTAAWLPDNDPTGIMVVEGTVGSGDSNMYRLRVSWEYCSPTGSCSGDPHIETFCGIKYTL